MFVPRRRRRRHIAAAVWSTVLFAAACTDSDTDAGGPEGADEQSPAVTTRGEGDTYEATIRRSEGGVAHITADTLEGASFGQGWASGEDRTCDLADQVLRVNGERAQWLGPGADDANVESDIAWRTIGIAELAADDWENASDEARALIGAYTDGWNGHLEAAGVEEIDDWCAGEDWVQPLDPVDVYTYARALALLASSGAVADLLPSAQPPTATPVSHTTGGSAALGSVQPSVASNGWAIGAERSAEDGGMLVGNPHFPWEGQLRFWEVHLTVPGEIDIYGVQLSGLPGVGIGFTEDFGWTHTVSAGNRFTAYRLDLVDGSPTTYRYGDEEREMTSEEISVEVLGDDGEMTTVSRTMWRSHYGPILDFPGFGWSEEQTITFRDANIDNDEFIDQYLAMLQAGDLDEFQEIHRNVTGVPLFNTIATSADGRAWYADTSATPNLSDEAIAGYQELLEDDPIVGIAADNGAVLLDGSDPLYEWEEVDGARDLGLVPFDDMPALERDDYAFNANDSFWMAHATEMLDGDFSPLHGPQETARSVRTRENATVLDDTSPEGPSGDDGSFTLDELADAAVLNRGYTSRVLLDDVVARCEGAGPVAVEAVDDEDGEGDEVLPAADVDVTEACEVLAGWDGIYDIDRVGPVVWRELVNRFDAEDLTEAGPLWADSFDPDDPVATPGGLAAPPADDEGDPVLVNLARAVQILEAAEVAVDVPLGEVQVADRNGTLVPIHGGDGRDGTPNVVGWGTNWATLDPALDALERTTVAPGSTLAEVTDGDTTTTGYRINSGTSFLLALAFEDDGPQAKAFLTYANTADREDPAYLEATEAFSEKRWRDVAFTEEDVAAATTETVTVRG
ncbi:N-acyl homoserine lactone acylase QqaR [soil metagenome]